MTENVIFVIEMYIRFSGWLITLRFRIYGINTNGGYLDDCRGVVLICFTYIFIRLI